MEAENKRKCRICNLYCSSIVQLCEHVTGNKHKMKLGIAAPDQVKRLGTMQLFLDMHMKGEPILGLEYIVETLVDSAYAYNCQLCEVQGDWRKLVGHIVDTDHMTRYIEKHNADLALEGKTYSRKGEHLRALREIAKKILKMSGRKSIQAHKADPSDPGAAEDGGDKSCDSPSKSGDERRESPGSPNEDSAAEARRRVARKRAPLRKKTDSATAAKVARLSVAARRNGALAAKRAIMSRERERSESRDYEREPDWSTSIQELEFRRNQDLLNYLRNYKIESDGDAHYIQQIVRNCTEALWRFREQQAREERLQNTQSTPLPPRSQPVPPPPYGYPGWNRPEAPCFPVNRADPYASGSQAPMPRPPSYPIRSPLPPSAATEMFFNSIKNMEEAEVVNVFHKIAATNPAFRGINIPSVIQYLKDTGRLKP